MSINPATLPNASSTIREPGSDHLNDEMGSLENRSVSKGWNLGPRIGKTLVRIAPLAIGIFIVGSLPVAAAGPWAACLTIAACLPLSAAPPLFAACIAGAAVSLALPTP